MHSPKYSLFFDNHTMKACPDVGANFDAQKFVAEVKSASTLTIQH